MTVENKYAIAIATLSDWFEKSRASLSTNEKENRALSEIHGIAMNLDWLLALLAPAVIGRYIKTWVFVFRHSIENRSIATVKPPVCVCLREVCLREVSVLEEKLPGPRFGILIWEVSAYRRCPLVEVPLHYSYY